MSRLHEAQIYRAQGFHPVPIQAGTKALALAKGQRATYEKRPPTTQELHSWYRDDRKNIALLLGRIPHLLVLNINRKHGQDGFATLRGYPLPPTPTILTPHGGLALLFRLPDRERYPFPFTLHTAVQGWPGIELRGTGGYQLVPSSQLDATPRKDGTVDPAGHYRFDDPWAMARLLGDLADLPTWLLDLWITCDRARAPSTTPPPNAGVGEGTQQRTIHSSEVKPPTTVYGEAETAAGLGASGLLALLHDVDTELACARFVGVPDGAVESVGCSFRCVLPGHEDAHPSATLHWNRKQALVLHDWHRLDGKEWWALPEVYMAQVLGYVPRAPKRDVALSLPAPSLATWRLRLLVDAKLIEPYPVDLPPLPDDAPARVLKVYEGFKRLLACKWSYAPGQPTMFARAFAAGWCGVGILAAWEGTQWLRQRQIIVPAGTYKGRPVYLPGPGGG